MNICFKNVMIKDISNVYWWVDVRVVGLNGFLLFYVFFYCFFVVLLFDDGGKYWLDL